MTLVIIGIVSLVLLAHVVHLVFTDDPTRHRSASSYRPPTSHADDEFAAGAHHRDLAA